MLNRLLLFPLIYAVVRLFGLTYRFRSQFPAVAADAAIQSYVLAIWHQNLFSGILAQQRRHCVIVSRSRDGDPVTFLCRKLGHEVVRGSSRRGGRDGRDKGGKEAKDEMIARLQAGLPGAVTVDGPRGPAHQVKPGIIEMARVAGVPVVPYLTLAQRYWTFRSWDAFRLPKPFTRVEVCYGAPIPIPPDTAFEDFAGYQQRIADVLQALEIEARQRLLTP